MYTLGVDESTIAALSGYVPSREIQLRDTPIGHGRSKNGTERTAEALETSDVVLNSVCSQVRLVPLLLAAGRLILEFHGCEHITG